MIPNSKNTKGRRCTNRVQGDGYYARLTDDCTDRLRLFLSTELTTSSDTVDPSRQYRTYQGTVAVLRVHKVHLNGRLKVRLSEVAIYSFQRRKYPELVAWGHSAGYTTLWKVKEPTQDVYRL